MRRSDRQPQPPKTGIDWRAWLIVAWVGWFGMQYTSMVLEQRGLAVWDRLFSTKLDDLHPFQAGASGEP
ncbi:hypothetical protein BH23PLA1_BH23PLA1_15770 [soil metagenome]